MKTLVIVESAAKAKTIQKYLNGIPELKKYGEFKVLASFGHINDIPVKEMGVDLRTWEATYVPIPGKTKVISQLRKAVQEADTVFIASDPDLEGEAIASHLQKELRIPTAKRITFREITKAAIKEAVQNPTIVDKNKVAAQESRRILDRVVGYELSPLLWRRFSTSRLSAGRVQSAALKMLVDRVKQAQEHTPTPYWELKGAFNVSGAELVGTAHEAVWDNQPDILKFMKGLNKTAWTSGWTARFTKTASKQHPSAPFVTSTLQQEAYNRLGIPAKRTMQLAQGLYEHGYITYMRTDSTNMSEEALKQINNYVTTTFGASMVYPRIFKTRAANAQEAHEAIRPSNVQTRANDIDEKDFTPTHKKLYDLIWRRAVASQMAPALYTNVNFSITTTCIPNLDFRGKHSILVEEGYLKVYSPDQKAAPESLQAWETLLQAGEADVRARRFEANGDVTRPAGFYNEPMLVKALEKEGIGRPSTYATIIDKLFSKDYVIKGMAPQVTVQVPTFRTSSKTKQLEQEDITLSVGGKDSDRMIPTNLGERVSEYVSNVVPFLVDTTFTSSMEDNLDLVGEGRQTKKELLDQFYGKFHKSIEVAAEEQKKHQPTKEQKAAAKKTEPTSPRNILREFDKFKTNVVQTRFGPALFVAPEKRFVSVAPFMTWREKTIETLTEKDIKFLLGLPVKVAGSTREIHIGPYGLYVKDGKTNLRLPKELWDDIYEGNIDVKAIASIEYVAPKKKVWARDRDKTE